MEGSMLSKKILLRAYERGDEARMAKLLFGLVRRGHANPLQAMNGHPFEDEWLDFATRSVRKHQAARFGYVYVVANPVFRGLYKVGSTSKGLDQRMRTLETAGVIGKFVEIFQAPALDRFAAEARAHRNLGAIAKRHKEFFAVDWQTACRVVQEAVQCDNALLTQSFDWLHLQSHTPEQTTQHDRGAHHASRRQHDLAHADGVSA